MQTTFKSSVLAFLVASGAVDAAPVPVLSTRQLNVITGAFSPINGAFVNMGNSVRAMTTRDSRTVTLMLQNGATALQAMNDATTTVRTSADLRAFESREIIDTSNTLNTQMSSVISDVVAQKLVLDQLGASSTVVNMLTQQKAASAALNDAVIAKFPNNRLQRDQARDNIVRIQAAFDSAIDTMRSGSAQPFTPPAAAAPAPAVPAAPAASPAPATPAAAPATPATTPAAAAPAGAGAGSASAPAPAASALSPSPAAPAPFGASPAPFAAADPMANVPPFVPVPAASSPIPFTQPQ